MLKIGGLAQQAGVSVRALRYYEQQGLLEPERTPRGQRVYAETAVDKVRLFQQLYAAGLTSANIATLLPCIATGHSTAEQRRMLREQRDRIRTRRDELQTALDRLDAIIEATELDPA